VSNIRLGASLRHPPTSATLSYLNIPSNKEADKATKEGAILSPLKDATCTLAAL